MLHAGYCGLTPTIARDQDVAQELRQLIKELVEMPAIAKNPELEAELESLVETGARGHPQPHLLSVVELNSQELVGEVDRVLATLLHHLHELLVFSVET